MTNRNEGLPQSVQTRLVAFAKSAGLDPSLILTRFATERLLYRLSRSPYADQFVLKGALLLHVWLGELVRPTRDADLLGFGDLSQERLTQLFQEVCSIEVQPDGTEFFPESVTAAQIRIEDPYGGTRVSLSGRLGRARLRVQIDVGIGDAVKPEPVLIDYRGLLDFPQPRLRAYRPETSIAEKLHAMVTLGERNSRMRDFFDIDTLAARMAFEGVDLVQAIEGTFAKRSTPISRTMPALTASFARAPERQAQWSAFTRRAGLASSAGELVTVVERIAAFVGPVLDAASSGRNVPGHWNPGGPWG